MNSRLTLLCALCLLYCPALLPTAQADAPRLLRATDAFSRPLPGLQEYEMDRFLLGRSFFRQPWVQAPSTVTARDGLGPLFSANACQGCHIRNGRGVVPDAPGQALRGAVVLLRNDDDLVPVYGQQLQTRAVAPLRPEARAAVHWDTHTEELPDGTMVVLRKPRLQLSDWSHGEPAEPARAEIRIAPPMIGLGLLEAIPDTDIIAHAVRQGERGGEGFPNRVPHATSGKGALGRFGWKASVAGIHQQSMKAFVQDMGITSRLFPHDTCTSHQTICHQMPEGGVPEVEPMVEDGVVFYASHLAPPTRGDTRLPAIRRGRQLFDAVGCAGCHQPRWVTGEHPGFPALSGREIFPYTDLLLHDMGKGLAGAVREGQAGERHWRTAPLWGLGRTWTVSGAQAGLLHDGRARNIVEAILWHGGEAEAARDQWAALTAADRHAVVRFMESL